jgi:hypothetical protein
LPLLERRQLGRHHPALARIQMAPLKIEADHVAQWVIAVVGLENRAGRSGICKFPC